MIWWLRRQVFCRGRRNGDGLDKRNLATPDLSTREGKRFEQIRAGLAAKFGPRGPQTLAEHLRIKSAAALTLRLEQLQEIAACGATFDAAEMAQLTTLAATATPRLRIDLRNLNEAGKETQMRMSATPSPKGSNIEKLFIIRDPSPREALDAAPPPSTPLPPTHTEKEAGRAQLIEQAVKVLLTNCDPDELKRVVELLSADDPERSLSDMEAHKANGGAQAVTQATDAAFRRFWGGGRTTQATRATAANDAAAIAPELARWIAMAEALANDPDAPLP